jgi:hypothetical protein
VRVVEGEAGGRFVALYREGDRLVGALTVDAPARVMKYRGLITRGAPWSEGLAFAAERRRRASRDLDAGVDTDAGAGQRRMPA